MSGQTIRDVVIRIKMEVANNRLPPPDTSAWRTAMEDVSRRSNGAGGTAVAAPAPGGDGLDDLRAGFAKAAADIQKLEQEENELAAASIAAKVALEQQAAAAQYAASIDPTGGNVIVNSAQRLVRSYNDLEVANLRVLAAEKQKLEVWAGTGEAAIRLGRGIAFVTAANEDELRESLKYVAAAQGVSDVLVGGVNLYKQISAARYAAAAATRAHSAAELVAAGVSGKNASALGQTLAVATSLHPALRAVAIAAGVTAVGLALVRDRSNEVNDEGDKLLLLFGLAGGAAYALSRQNHSAAGSLYGVGEAAKYADENVRRYQDAARIGAEAIRLQQQAPGFDLTGRGGADQLRQIQELQENRAAYLRNIEQQTGSFGGGALGQAKVELEIASALLQSQRDSLSIKQKITEELRQQQQFAAGQLDSVKRRVEAEKSALQSDKERFGRLNPGEQARLKDIAGRQQQGQPLTRQEAEFLERNGFGGDLTKNFFAKEGDAAGFGGVQEGLGLGRKLEQAQRDLIAEQNSTGLALEELSQTIVESEQTAQRGLNKLIQTMNETFVRQSLYDQLARRMEDLERNNKNAAMGRKPR